MTPLFETETQSYYEILDINPNAGQNDIRQAYFRAKAAYGKDSAALYSLFDEQQTRLVLENIEQAYLVLSNPEKRKEYDRVHGFLHATDDTPLPAPVHKTDTASSSKVFSFSATADAAHQAAQTVFGEGEFPSNTGITETPTTVQASANKDPDKVRLEDYATPRTLAAATSQTFSDTDYGATSENPVFSGRENRLGVIRRNDLNKPYVKDPAMEESISNEQTFRGDFLKRVREYKNISLDEMSEFTKISKSYLNCVECEEFEGLPAPAYLRGFVVQVAKALKLPHDKAANAYMTHYKNTFMK